jgi:hypothetical protein
MRKNAEILLWRVLVFRHQYYKRQIAMSTFWACKRSPLLHLEPKSIARFPYQEVRFAKERNGPKSPLKIAFTDLKILSDVEVG